MAVQALRDGAFLMAKWVLIVISKLFLSMVIFFPICVVMASAFSQGWTVFANALLDTETVSALGLSLKSVGIAVLLNGIFGVSAAWYLTRYRIVGKRFWISLIELPFSISPVISGMLLILSFGSHSFLGQFLETWGVKVMFTPLAVMMATLFVTLPFMAREVMTLMQVQGTEEEIAAYLLGAKGWQIFLKVTLPNILPAVLVGAVLTAARALGEFGAVSVVSGHIRGLTTTLPLHIEILYNDYAFSAAFAVSSVLIALSIFSLMIRYGVQHWVYKKGR
jgi:sulfate transport system permease protein